MKVKTISEIPSAKGIIPAGQIIEISPELLERLQGKVELIPPATDGRDLSHYCQAGDAWCSVKLPGSSTQCRQCTAENKKHRRREKMEPSPILELRKELGLTEQAMAAELMLTTTRYHHVEDGAYPELLTAIRDIAEAQRGEGEGWKMAEDYLAWRESLPLETIKEVEKNLWPAGKAYGMCV